MGSKDNNEDDLDLPANAVVIKGSFDEWYKQRFGALLSSDLEIAEKAKDPHMFGIVKPSDRHKMKVLDWGKPVKISKVPKTKKK
ncbi:MAG: hypothetical protein B7X98_01755 [Methylophilaceae bacterium 17-43-7]|nr:MAG: hypothetical protein B7X98_01755 [Methylophilaceae bacterium 17-43-7]